MTVIVTSITHIIAQFSGAAIYEKFGLKTAMSLSFGLSGFGGIFMYIYGLSHQDSQIFTVLIFMMKFGMSSATNLCYIGHKGCFPTLFATSSFGYCNFLGRVVSMGSSVSAQLSQSYSTGLFAISSTLGAFIVLNLRKIKESDYKYEAETEPQSQKKQQKLKDN